MEKIIVISIGIAILALLVGYVLLNSGAHDYSKEVLVKLENTPVIRLKPMEKGVLIENLTDHDIVFERFFIDDLEATGIVRKKSSILTPVPLDGTEYLYLFEIGDKSVEASVVSVLSEESLERGLFYNWEYLARQRKVPSWVFDIKEEDRTFSWVVHGVKVTVAFEPNVSKLVPEYLMKAYFKQAVIDFHRHWSMYRGFPIDEYRIIAMDGEEMPPFSETVFGHHVPKSFLLKTIRESLNHDCEPLSHGIGHVWMGDLISTEVHKIDGWWMEGFDHFNGIITLKDRVRYLEGDIDYLRKFPHKDYPLSKAYSKFFGTSDAYFYYAKGGILAYIISKRLKENGKSWEGFMSYLYEKYFLSENGRWRRFKDERRLSTRKLLSDLKEYSGVDFSDLFERYVYGSEDITKEVPYIYEKYLPSWNR